MSRFRRRLAKLRFILGDTLFALDDHRVELGASVFMTSSDLVIEIYGEALLVPAKFGWDSSAPS